MPNEQENKDEQIIQEWIEIKKLQHPKYWMQMKDKLQIVIHQKRKIRIIKCVAIFTLPVLACGFYLLQNNLYHTPLRTEQILAKILPGDKKAILHTSNGNSLVLSGDTFSLTEINGTQISSTQDEGIVYTPQTTNNTIKIYNTLVVPLKGEYNITLCDGTQVWLNSSSSLRYPVIFSDSVREVHLEGEAFFIVTENKEKPFIVTTKDYSIKVLGTAFNVMDYNDDNYSHTTLAKGKIEILHGDKRQILIPGEQAVHGRRVGGEFRARPLLRPDRVAQAARSAASLLRLIERGEQQRQKRHIVGQRQRPGRAVIRIQRAAQAAVDAVVAQALRLCQPAEVGDHVSEHAHLSSGSGRSNSRWFKSAP